uniref:cytochrome c oxidase subunit II n=1 Tax=Diprion wenshanicus TaxID=2980992 RepID=UPI0023F361CF|nr:cytochrome c oxidase subunit II [Diprion wenshanicus]WDY84656.1 cytochrome c oxidase subunit II [Diprion wenshanicus]
MTTWSSFNLQNANSPIMEQMIFFHDYTMMILILITTSIIYLLLVMMMNKFINKNIINKQNIEIIWTIMPSILLILIAMPSIHLLYLTDEINKPLITIKTIGHQWYWSYEYSDFKNIEFESYMNKYINLNSFRLLDVDNNTVMPFNTNIRMIISSNDVIHSWTIPSLGKKIDAIPGRLNQISLYIKRPGLMFGQCSEICGANHSFMPIVVESIPMFFFLKWINSF